MLGFVGDRVPFLLVAMRPVASISRVHPGGRRKGQEVDSSVLGVLMELKGGVGDASGEELCCKGGEEGGGGRGGGTLGLRSNQVCNLWCGECICTPALERSSVSIFGAVCGGSLSAGCGCASVSTSCTSCGRTTSGSLSPSCVSLQRRKKKGP